MCNSFILNYVRTLLYVHNVLFYAQYVYECVGGKREGVCRRRVRRQIIIFLIVIYFVCHRFRNVRRRRVVFYQKTRKPQNRALTRKKLPFWFP